MKQISMRRKEMSIVQYYEDGAGIAEIEFCGVKALRVFDGGAHNFIDFRDAETERKDYGCFVCGNDGVHAFAEGEDYGELEYEATSAIKTLCLLMGVGGGVRFFDKDGVEKEIPEY